MYYLNLVEQKKLEICDKDKSQTYDTRSEENIGFFGKIKSLQPHIYASVIYLSTGYIHPHTVVISTPYGIILSVNFANQ